MYNHRLLNTLASVYYGSVKSTKYRPQHSILFTATNSTNALFSVNPYQLIQFRSVICLICFFLICFCDVIFLSRFGAQASQNIEARSGFEDCTRGLEIAIRSKVIHLLYIIFLYLNYLKFNYNKLKSKHVFSK